MDNAVEKAEAQLRRRVHDEVNCLVTDPRLRGDAAIACEMIMEAAKTAIAAAVAAERARCAGIAAEVMDGALKWEVSQGNVYRAGWTDAAQKVLHHITTPPAPTPVAAPPADEAGEVSADDWDSVPDAVWDAARDFGRRDHEHAHDYCSSESFRAAGDALVRAVLAYGDARAPAGAEGVRDG